MRFHSLILLCLTAVFTSCEFKPVHPALWSTGQNKKEFRKVLDYYSRPVDSLKLRAAEFLILHLKGHYYFAPDNPKNVDVFFQNIDSFISLPILEDSNLYSHLRRELIDVKISKSLSQGTIRKPKYRKCSDANTLNSKFLIENIEYAFKAWEFPWAQNYDFDEFCQYILPYRYGTEFPEPWRKVFFEQFKWIADSVETIHDTKEVASFLNKQFNLAFVKSNTLKNSGIILKLSTQLDAMLFANCNYRAGFGVSMMRALGIPAIIVGIPAWGNRDGSHEMVAILDTDKKWHVFDFGDAGPEKKYKLEAPKLYFKIFEKRKNFRPVWEDASNVFMDVFDLEVQIHAKEKAEIYLCVFKNQKWYPLCKGENRQNKAVFRNIGLSRNFYIAAIKSKGKLKPVSKPFSTDSLKIITYYSPDYENRITATFTRKYPLFKKHIPRLKALIGGEFFVSESRNFAFKTSIFKVDTLLKYHHNIIKCSEQKGKFVRYDFPVSLDSLFDGPAEIAFYTTIEDSLCKIEGQYFGSHQLSKNHIDLMTDNDVLTYTEVWDYKNDLNLETGRSILRKYNQPIWIGMELDTTILVTHVGICPRNDKNGIYAGMEYELFYWDDDWISLGKKVATTDKIRFDGIPENAVLWLRNLDEGKEERIFTLKEGKQVWW